VQHGGLRDKVTANTDKDKPLAKLLVVDDDPDTILALKIGLINYGFLVDAFTNPEEALQKFKYNAESYCLALLDIKMPALSGIQLAKKVKEANPNVKVLLLTGVVIRDIEFSKVFPSTIVDGFVQKPTGIRKLTDKILSLIGETKGRSSSLKD
jgi:two-component system, cell cycle sensor histidine kinase and response regulator CckA